MLEMCETAFSGVRYSFLATARLPQMEREEGRPGYSRKEMKEFEKYVCAREGTAYTLSHYRSKSIDRSNQRVAVMHSVCLWNASGEVAVGVEGHRAGAVGGVRAR
jgi:hypothetical protein